MPKLTRIYTRTGDDGTTGLGSGDRVSKSSARIEAYGTVDELNSVIGVALAVGMEGGSAKFLKGVQNDLFHLGSDLCYPESAKDDVQIPQIEESHVKALEEQMDLLSKDLGPLENFILPGGCMAAAQLHVARTVARRAERRVVELAGAEKVGPHVVAYLNRLSDLLFVMARCENRANEVPDVSWDSRA